MTSKDLWLIPMQYLFFIFTLLEAYIITTKLKYYKQEQYCKLPQECLWLFEVRNSCSFVLSPLKTGSAIDTLERKQLNAAILVITAKAQRAP